MDDKTATEFKYRDKDGVLKSYKINDKEICKYPLFKTEKEEKNFYKEFKTIYHLRDFLMNTDQKADIRWIYLALHHILKYRGHFVNQGETFDLNNINIADSMVETIKRFDDIVGLSFKYDDIDKAKINEILADRNRSKSKKAFDLNELYKVDEQQSKELAERKQKQLKELFIAVVGNKISLNKIFNNDEYSEKQNKEFPKDIYYKNENFEDQVGELEKYLQPEEIEVLSEGKKVYEAIVLSRILTKGTLSAYMKDKYETHSRQLAKLKEIARLTSKEFYEQIFGDEGVYTKYIDGAGNPAKKLTRENFYKEIKKTFENQFEGLTFPVENKDFDWSKTSLSQEEKNFFEEISKDMFEENYLPKQRMSDNGAIPYQVHEYELLKIIENQGKYYPFLMEKLGGEYKIATLMKFRIPYYVGPLTEATEGEAGKKKSDRSQFAWMQKKIDSKITPWNFDEVVDKDASSVEFIERMTSFCTYLPDEKVLPKNSLLYQEFCVYNELITSGYREGSRREYFGEKMMNEIVEKLFKEKRKVYEEDVLDFLRNGKNIQADEIFGIDRHTKNGKPSFNNSLSTFIDLKSMGISPQMIEDDRNIFDEIVKWQTIFTDKKSLREKIERANKEWNILTDEQIKKLAQKHYGGFGNLSRKLLDGITDDKSGLTIIETLKSGGYDNFMRLVSGTTADRYSFKSQIENAQTKKQTDDLTYEIVESLAGSPAIKKGIWQSLQLIKELERYLGRENISKIVIEMSREVGVGRTKSRYKQLEKIYKNFEEANKEVFDELNNYSSNEKALANEKLHLYFRQNGKDAYTGERLEILQLSSYEVDHIIPQCFLKDDSIDNKVLVSHISNQQKGGDVPSEKVVAKMKPTWEKWLKSDLISQKKFKNLTTGVLTDKVKEGFINRQLVENRQITKNVAIILAKYFDDTDTVILTPNASLASQFRRGTLYLPNPEYDYFNKDAKPFIEEQLHKDFPKNRDLHDYHHAHDAYLNAIVALYLYREYPELKNAWVYGEYERNSDEIFGRWVKSRRNKSLQLISGMRNEKWEQIDPDTGEQFDIARDDVMEQIEKTLGFKNVNVVYKTEKQLGKFGDESIYKKNKTSDKFAAGIKNHLNPNRYGGTKAPVSAFIVVVRLKNNEIKALSVPSMFAKEYLKTDNKLALIQRLNPKEKIARIEIDEIDKYTKFENIIDGQSVVRLVSSYQEAIKAESLSVTPSELRSVENADEKVMGDIYDAITKYLVANKVYNKTHLDNWQGKIREEFDTLEPKKKRQFIKDAFLITKRGTTNAKGMIKGKIGKASEQQQHTNTLTDVIHQGTTIIYQSITGLYETRKTIE